MAGYFVAPTLWLVLGLLGAFRWTHLSSDKYLGSPTDEQRQKLRETFAGRTPSPQRRHWPAVPPPHHRVDLDRTRTLVDVAAGDDHPDQRAGGS